MGNRPSSTILYGFTYRPDKSDFDDEDDSDRYSTEYEQDKRWEAQVFALCNVPEERPAVDWEVWNAAKAAKEAALRSHGQRITWGCLGDGDEEYAIGFVLAHGDWDAPEVVDLTLPENAEEKLRALCDFYDVPYSAPSMLLLSSYR